MFPRLPRRIGRLPHWTRRNFYANLAQGAVVLDVGCLGFRELQNAARLGRNDIIHHGVDYMKPDELQIPSGFSFKEADLDEGILPYPDDSFDGVVASHVIEHIGNPIRLFGEFVRICKPGGVVYLEAPSERSLLLPGMPFQHKHFYSLSFYDDPTHLSRPWTPQSLYRLACYFGCEPLRTGYVTSWKHRLALILVLPAALITKRGGWLERSVWLSVGWASHLLLRKPVNVRGAQPFKYYIPRGN